MLIEYEVFLFSVWPLTTIYLPPCAMQPNKWRLVKHWTRVDRFNFFYRWSELPLVCDFGGTSEFWKTFSTFYSNNTPFGMSLEGDFSEYRGNPCIHPSSARYSDYTHMKWNSDQLQDYKMTTNKRIYVSQTFCTGSTASASFAHQSFAMVVQLQLLIWCAFRVDGECLTLSLLHCRPCRACRPLH